MYTQACYFEFSRCNSPNNSLENEIINTKRISATAVSIFQYSHSDKGRTIENVCTFACAK